MQIQTLMQQLHAPQMDMRSYPKPNIPHFRGQRTTDVRNHSHELACEQTKIHNQDQGQQNARLPNFIVLDQQIYNAIAHAVNNAMHNAGLRTGQQQNQAHISGQSQPAHLSQPPHQPNS